MSNTKKILITGASSGIGCASTRLLINEGHTVIGLARDFTKNPIESDRFIPISIDFSEIDNLPNQLSEINKAHPDINAVVCCAGRGQFGSLEEFSYSQIRELMDLNFLSQAYVSRCFLPTLKKQGAGNLIFIGSEAALEGSRKGSIYCASKFALRGLAQSLREECAHSGIHVSIINPGMVKTTFFDDLDFAPGEDEQNFIEPEDVANNISMILNSRCGTNIDELNLSPLKKVIQFKKK